MNNNKYIELKVNRTRCELNQEEVGKMIGLTASTYAGKENGKIVFTLDEAITISNTINNILKKKGYDNISLEKLFSR